MINERAAEIITSGWCPLDCNYCYILKSDDMKDVHEKIRNDLKSGVFLDRLRKFYGDRLTHLSLWGTEPLLTMVDLIEHMPEVFASFPKITDIGFSTSLMVDPKALFEFIRCLVGRDILLKVQISTDGPSQITDKNRMKGAANQIVRNLRELLEMINSIELGTLKIDIHFKPTHANSTIRDMVEDPSNMSQVLYGEKCYPLIDEYLDYFENIFKMFREVNKQKNVSLRESKLSTLMIPGKYTTTDGEMFDKYVKLFHDRGEQTAYDSRYVKPFKYGAEFHKRRTFTCSGGDSNFGIGKNLHMCHRTFYFDHEEYIRGAFRDNEIDEWEVSDFSPAIIDMMNKWYVVPYEDAARFRYVMRGYHDYIDHQWITLEALLLELAVAGQVKSYYATSSKMRKAFVLFFLSCMTCPMENVLNTGSIHLQTIGLVRMFANGAFMRILRRRIATG